MSAGKGGKNRRRGKNENETEKRELVFKEDGQGEGGRTMRYGVNDATSPRERVSVIHTVFVFVQSTLK